MEAAKSSNTSVSITPSAFPPATQPRAVRILAKSLFRELKSSGYTRTEIVAFATELLSLVSSDLREESTVAEAE